MAPTSTTMSHFSSSAGSRVLKLNKMAVSYPVSPSLSKNLRHVDQPDYLGVLVLWKLKEHETGEYLVAMEATAVSADDFVTFHSGALVGVVRVGHFESWNELSGLD